MRLNLTLRQELETNRIQLVARKFRILDALALTFAAALSYAAAREFYPPSLGFFKTRDLGHALSFANATLFVFTVLLAMLVLFDKMMLSRSARHPGRACLISLSFVIPIATLAELRDLDHAFVRDSVLDGMLWVVYFAVLRESDSWALPTVIATWTVLFVQGRFVRPCDWLDAAGILVGVLWVTYTFMHEMHLWSVIGSWNAAIVSVGLDMSLIYPLSK